MKTLATICTDALQDTCRGSSTLEPQILWVVLQADQDHLEFKP
jgi:hypothetical protein